MVRRFLGMLIVSALFAGCVISPRRGGTVNGGGSAAGKLYVATAGTILRFGNAFTANTSVAPEATISGSQTQLSSPQRILLDATNDRLLVANQSGGSILIFLKASTASGNIGPNAVLTSTGNMTAPVDLAIDAGANLLYVADGQNILVFSGEATLSGNVNANPARTINFTFTIGAILLDAANNRLFIADPADNAVQILPNASSASGSGTLLVTPITGSNTLLQHPNGFTFDGGGRLIVSNLSGPSITIYPAAALSSGGNVAPVANLTGSSTKLSGPGQLAFNANAGSSGELYVADSPAASLFTYLNTGGLTINDNIAPTRTISGSGTNLNTNAINGMALDTSR
jgi:hypothetical protein